VFAYASAAVPPAGTGERSTIERSILAVGDPGALTVGLPAVASGTKEARKCQKEAGGNPQETPTRELGKREPKAPKERARGRQLSPDFDCQA